MRIHEEKIINTLLKKKILLICGTMNTTTMMHQISTYMSEHECYFTHMYADGLVNLLAKRDLINFVPLSGDVKNTTTNYFKEHNLKIDYYGKANQYDLVITCTDLIIPKNIKQTKIVHVQEGMTDPEDYRYYLVKYLKFPRFIASTSTMGMSEDFDIFCVASEGYRELFKSKGINPDKIKVTGIPNYDNCKKYYNNNFPYKNFVLAATSDLRETYKYENRKEFIKNALEIANGRQLIFKLHPNEKVDRATKEIYKYAPGSLIFSKGNVHEMIANCDILITRYSTVVYTGLSLNKEVYSEADINLLKQLCPLQNNGTSAFNIAKECLKLLQVSVKREKNQLFKFEPMVPIKLAVSKYIQYYKSKASA